MGSFSFSIWIPIGIDDDAIITFPFQYILYRSDNEGRESEVMSSTMMPIIVDRLMRRLRAVWLGL